MTAPGRAVSIMMTSTSHARRAAEAPNASALGLSHNRGRDELRERYSDAADPIDWQSEWQSIGSSLAPLIGYLFEKVSAPGGIRTPNPQIRSRNRATVHG
jgi:hypothetical protein